MVKHGQNNQFPVFFAPELTEHYPEKVNKLPRKQVPKIYPVHLIKPMINKLY